VAAALSSEPGDEPLELRVERLEAIEAVRATVARYCRVIDETRDVAELRELLTPDAVLRNPGMEPREGRDAVLDYYAAYFASGVGMSRHHPVNQAVTVEGRGRARHSAYFLLLLARQDESLVGWGNYDDTLERGADGGWRYSVKVNEVLGLKPLPEGWA
jgi:ketosteroid isomerase-like protein